MSAQIKSVWPLAPGQRGILFQSIGGGKPGDYVIQIVLELSGVLDLARAETAWRGLVARHAALRTAFVWEGQPHPLQVIGHRARLCISHEDLSNHTEPEHYIEEWLTRDRAAGFALNAAPLMRVKLFTLPSQKTRMIVTFHHAALDGWSIPVLLRDWVALYGGDKLPEAPNMADYLGWVHGQDKTAAAAFWRDAVPQVEPPWPLPAPERTDMSRRGDLSIELPAKTGARLIRIARRLGVTPAVVVQAGWALLQSRILGANRATWGLARAGRPAALPQIAARAGMYLTTLPISVDLKDDLTLADLCTSLQQTWQAQAPHEHLSLAEVQSARGGPGGTGLIYSVVVFENYPTDATLLGQIPGLTVTGLDVLEQTSMPLALFVSGGTKLRLLFDAHRIAASAARQVLDDISDVLSCFARAPATPLAEITLGTKPVAPAPKTLCPSRPASRDVQDHLASIWGELLDTIKPSGTDNFFDLGGHSLLAITLQERIRERFAIETEIPDLFRHATLDAQAAHIAALQTGTKARPTSNMRTRQAGRARLRNRAKMQKKDKKSHV